MILRGEVQRVFVQPSTLCSVCAVESRSRFLRPPLQLSLFVSWALPGPVLRSTHQPALWRLMRGACFVSVAELPEVPLRARHLRSLVGVGHQWFEILPDWVVCQ